MCGVLMELAVPSSDLSVAPPAVPAVSSISEASRPRADPAHQCPLGTKQIDMGPVKPAQHQDWLCIWFAKRLGESSVSADPPATMILLAMMILPATMIGGRRR